MADVPAPAFEVDQIVPSLLRYRLFLLTTVLAGTVGFPQHPQAQPAGTEAARTGAVPAQPAAGETLLELPTVSVEGSRERANGPVAGFAAQRSATGTKTDSAIEETPAAITVIPRDQIELQDARSLNEALRYTAGINTSTRGVSGGGRYDQFSFRGFGGVGSPGTNYLDGMRLLGAGYSTPQLDTYSLERIEVLKGPASILYGQANPAGLINQVRKLPTETGFHEVGIEGGSFGTIQGTADLSGRLNENGSLLGRITGLVRQTDGQVTQKGAEERRVLIQPSITYKPDEKTTITLEALYQRDPLGGYYGAVPAVGSALYNPLGRSARNFYDGEPGHEKYDRTQTSIGYQAEHRFNDSFTVRQNFRYFRVNSDYASVYTSGLRADNRTVTRGVADSVGHANTFTVDNQAVLQVNTGPVRHTLLAGLDYIRSDGDYVYRINSTGGPTLDLFNPVYGQAVRIPAISQSTYQTLDQLGFYFQDQIQLGKLTVQLGGRNDWAGQQTNNRLSTASNANIGTHDQAFTGRAGIIYNFDNGIAPYYSYSESFQPTSGTDRTGAPFKPTSGTSHEFGIKYAPPGWRSIFTVDYFDTHQSNVLTTDPAAPTFSVQTGEIRSRGLEAEAHASPLPGLNVVAAFTYLDAKYVKDNSGLQGKVLYAAPKNSTSGFADYSFQSGALEGFGFGGGVRYIGSSQSTATNAFVVKGTTLFDAEIHYDVDKLFPRIKGARFQVNATNLADRRYVATCFSTSSCFYGPQRLVLASLKYRW